MLNFHTNLEEDGGTLVVPMFHKYVRRYCEDYKHLRKVSVASAVFIFYFMFTRLYFEALLTIYASDHSSLFIFNPSISFTTYNCQRTAAAVGAVQQGGGGGAAEARPPSAHAGG